MVHLLKDAILACEGGGEWVALRTLVPALDDLADADLCLEWAAPGEKAGWMSMSRVDA